MSNWQGQGRKEHPIQFQVVHRKQTTIDNDKRDQQEVGEYVSFIPFVSIQNSINFILHNKLFRYHPTSMLWSTMSDLSTKFHINLGRLKPTPEQIALNIIRLITT